VVKRRARVEVDGRIGEGVRPSKSLHRPSDDTPAVLRYFEGALLLGRTDADKLFG